MRFALSAFGVLLVACTGGGEGITPKPLPAERVAHETPPSAHPTPSSPASATEAEQPAGAPTKVQVQNYCRVTELNYKGQRDPTVDALVVLPKRSLYRFFCTTLAGPTECGGVLIDLEAVDANGHLTPSDVHTLDVTAKTVSGSVAVLRWGIHTVTVDSGAGRLQLAAPNNPPREADCSSTAPYSSKDVKSETR